MIAIPTHGEITPDMIGSAASDLAALRGPRVRVRVLDPEGVLTEIQAAVRAEGGPCAGRVFAGFVPVSYSGFSPQSDVAEFSATDTEIEVSFARKGCRRSYGKGSILLIRALPAAR